MHEKYAQYQESAVKKMRIDNIKNKLSLFFYASNLFSFFRNLDGTGHQNMNYCKDIIRNRRINERIRVTFLRFFLLNTFNVQICISYIIFHIFTKFPSFEELPQKNFYCEDESFLVYENDAHNVFLSEYVERYPALHVCTS